MHAPIPTADNVNEYGDCEIGGGGPLGCFCWIFCGLILGIPLLAIIARRIIG